MSEEKSKIGITNVYFKKVDENDSEAKLLSSYGCELIEPKISDEPIMFANSYSGQIEISLKDKNLEKYKKVKSKRLKKKYFEKTIFYQLTREKRW